VTTLDREKLRQGIGALAPALLAQVGGGLAAALDLDSEL
jgi:hypothetical protein